MRARAIDIPTKPGNSSAPDCFHLSKRRSNCITAACTLSQSAKKNAHARESSKQSQRRFFFLLLFALDLFSRTYPTATAIYIYCIYIHIAARAKSRDFGNSTLFLSRSLLYRSPLGTDLRTSKIYFHAA